MTNKKEYWIKRKWKFITALVIIAIGLLIATSGVYHYSTSYICSHHPEKCICNEWKTVCESGYKAGRMSKDCEKFCENQNMTCNSFIGNGCNGKRSNTFKCSNNQEYEINDYPNLKCTNFRFKTRGYDE